MATGQLNSGDFGPLRARKTLKVPQGIFHLLYFGISVDKHVLFSPSPVVKREHVHLFYCIDITWKSTNTFFSIDNLLTILQLIAISISESRYKKSILPPSFYCGQMEHPTWDNTKSLSVLGLTVGWIIKQTPYRLGSAGLYGFSL